MNVMSINPTSCSRVSDKSVYENGELIDSNIQMGNYTTYPSAFLVVDPDGIYSKHYYAGTQRIAARMGNQNADEIFADKKKSAKLSGTENDTDNEFSPDKLKDLQRKDLQSYLDKAGKEARLSFKEYKPNNEEQEQAPPPSEGAGEGSYAAYGAVPEEMIYYYHPDHLGTATYLTDINGYAYEFFLNLPFGETMAEQHSQTADYVNRWKFTGHELDKETGLYYANARYYDPKLSIFISVDPLAEKYPNWNPYAYCFNSPIVYRDPDGRDPITGIIDALSSFALDVGMDFLGGIILENKTVSQAYNDIGWISAGWGAIGSYAISSVTPTGTATTMKLAKIAKSDIGQIAIGIVGKMTTKAIDNYNSGKYDINGKFSFSNIDITELFWESTIETLVEKGFKGSSDQILKTLEKQNKKLFHKLNKMANKMNNGESDKRLRNYSKNVTEELNKSVDIGKEYLKEKTEEKINQTIAKELIIPTNKE